MQVNFGQMVSKLTRTNDVPFGSIVSAKAHELGKSLANGRSDAKNEFLDFIEQALDKPGIERSGGQVSEEEVYAAVLGQRLRLEGSDLAAQYKREKNSSITRQLSERGSVSLEQAAQDALREMIRQGRISSEKAAELNGLAFAVSQLDDNRDSLFADPLPSETGEPRTVSPAMPLEQALFAVAHNVLQIDQGELEAKPLAVDTADESSSDVSSETPPTGAGTGAAVTTHSNSHRPKSPHETEESSQEGSHVSHAKPRRGKRRRSNKDQEADESDATSESGATGAGRNAKGSGRVSGFSWHPDSDGRVSVTMPKEISGDLRSVEIHSDLPAAADTKIESGRYEGKTQSGSDRYSFSKPGKDYGHDVVVVGFRKGGKQVAYEVADGGEEVVA